MSEEPKREKNPGINWNDIGAKIDRLEEKLFKEIGDIKESVKKKAEDSKY